MTFKEQVYKSCCDILNDKIQLLKQTLSDLKESASNETKSTAGDKHETALAMLQIEQKNAGIQLENVLTQRAILDKINPKVKPLNITNGAFVKTNKGYLFLGAPIGKITVAGINVIALSSQSPLGSALTKLSIGETTTVNGRIYEILEIE